MSNNPTPTPAPKRIRRDQDQQLADDITAARQTITTVQSDAELSAFLAPRGYDNDKLAEGLVLQQAAQDAFNGRQQAMGTQKQATAALTGAEAAARHAYGDFRDTARAIFKDSGTRNGLGLTGIVSKDTQKFITAARASYEVALNTPTYQSELTKYGYPATTIQSARALLDAFLAADNAQEQAIGAAQRATQQRDEAAATLAAWISQFRAIAKVATRGRADLVQKLGL